MASSNALIESLKLGVLLYKIATVNRLGLLPLDLVRRFDDIFSGTDVLRFAYPAQALFE
ncbi:hypothetical protein [Leptodesmis sichuanensis]|uniref:hypothetical protein n=1 Tax=Leptodesmis sichuanensis TaxID=2906798 RepID=UPI001F438F16|nr:hypothetical protein [Leptodesmis sichuanensis]UIE39662.1 hypothetical protein KIK02_08945 [Leptodesmis sichuanensis A121]